MPLVRIAVPYGQPGGATGEAYPLLLAAAGRKTSESAAVRDDAGSACAATGAGGIERGGHVSGGICLGLGKERFLQKRAGIRGHRACAGANHRPWGYFAMSLLRC